MAGTPRKKALEDYQRFFAAAARQDEVPDEVEDGDEGGFVVAGTNTAAGADRDDDRGGGDTDSASRARASAADVRAVDPARSRIVLVGAPAYADPQLPDVPQVARNLRDLAAVFTDPKLGGFPAKHCVTVSPDATVAEVGDVLEVAAEEAEDLLLFYFAGHGLVGARGELFLALHDTRFRNPGYSGLRFDTIRDTFLHLGTKAKNRAVIIDSCFSGRAIGPTLAPSDGALADGLEISGSYTLASAPSNSLALVREGEPHTAFTGRLLELLREGSTRSGDLISLRDVYHHLLTRMRADGLPLPQMRGTETADQLGLVRNARPAPLVPAPLPQEILALLQSGRPRARQAGVEELADWLSSSDPRQVLAARLALEKVIGRDIKDVADVARRVLATAHSGSAPKPVSVPVRVPVPVSISNSVSDSVSVPVSVSVSDGFALRQGAIAFLHKAELTVAPVKKAADKAYVFAEIAELLSATDSQKAVNLAHQALMLAPHIANAGTQAEVKARACAALHGPHPVIAGQLAEEVEQLALGIANHNTTDKTAEVHLANIISALATADAQRAGRIAAHAIDFADSIADPNLKGHFLAWIAWGEAAAGLPRAAWTAISAQRAAGKMTDPDSNTLTVAIAAAAFAATDGEQAAVLAERAQALIARTSSAVIEGGVLSIAALAVAAIDSPRAARLTYRAGLNVGEIVARDGADAPVLAIIGAAIAKTDPRRAERYADGITDPYRKANTLVNMARIWLKGSLL